MFGCEEKRKLYSPICSGVLGAFSKTSETEGMGILPTGEEEVKVTKSEASMTIEVGCKRE
ncbi:hypothetical protein GCM10011583_65520 [Streptomyces camponoticapitis]|uniref:Uncharacterized protein n=1 Tax=Streptomyces camponoticapitis TaxID=1616125 RepID=A0ABQ2EWP2_9ACTN|nr:hypothetical protein GCM10011583_65520 [Streptomyces camponoticapitis]